MKSKNIMILASFIVAFFTGCNPPREKTPEIIEAKENVILKEAINPQKELNVALLIVDGVYNSELIAPYDILQHTIFHTNPGMKVFTIAPRKKMIRSFEGLNIMPDFGFIENNYPEIDVLVVPSAEHSMDTDLDNADLIDFVAKTGMKADFVMSLCDGAFVLAKAGLVDNKESTTFPSDIDKYQQTFPDLTVHKGVSFVHDGKLLTSVGGAKSYDVALYLVHLLYGEKVAIGVAKGLVIDWNPADYKFIKVD